MADPNVEQLGAEPLPLALCVLDRRTLLTEIARRECIDRLMLRTALRGMLNTLRAEAGRDFTPTSPEAKRKRSPGLPPMRSADH